MQSEFQVRKSDIARHRIVETELPSLNDGEIRVEIDHFGFTANNVTYAAAGEALGYWQFFPASDNTDQGWGIIPVWAFANVVASKNDAVPVGDRLYGYFPPATYLTMSPDRVTENVLFDGAEHRQKLPLLYNRYVRVLSDKSYNKKTDTSRVLLGPLLLTSFCLVDYLRENEWFGAEQIVIVSASSKTSLGLAHGLRELNEVPTIVGLTSERNRKFVWGTDVYDHAASYETITTSLERRSSLVVDMAGSNAILDSLRKRLGEDFLYRIGVGLTHWDNRKRADNTVRHLEKSENFFAPGYVLDRSKQMSPGQFDEQSSSFVTRIAEKMFEWMWIEEPVGLSGLTSIYPAFCQGEVLPGKAYIIRM